MGRGCALRSRRKREDGSGPGEWSHREPALVKGDDGTAMITGDVPDGLYGAGVFVDTVIRTAVRIQHLTGYRYIKSDEIVVLKDLDAFDSCFLWQFCQIVGCFHSCSKPPLK